MPEWTTGLVVILACVAHMALSLIDDDSSLSLGVAVGCAAIFVGGCVACSVAVIVPMAMVLWAGATALSYLGSGGFI